MAFMPNFRHTPSQEPNRRVVSLAYDGLCTFEFGITAEIFGLSRPEAGPNWYRFESVALEDKSLRACGGLMVAATGSAEDLHQAGTVIVPGWRGAEAPVPQRICDELVLAHKRGARIVSICGGAFVLAAAGLLDGRRATTHWQFAKTLAERHPAIEVEADRLYIDDGDILTSAGSSAGIDLCLHIVRSDFGARIANSVARRLVMYSHRQGGQAQFVEQPIPAEYEAHRLSSLLDHVRADLAAPHSIASLAGKAGMSPRTFQRRFRSLTGLPPLKWILKERLECSRMLLETSSAPLDGIALATGLGSAENLRLQFVQTYGVSPLNYRKQFATPGMRLIAGSGG
ncbi:transcriptional regulator FtrA [Rhizobium hidalgonense]|uniref:transcriptional regulator FtrA n=1 Tax=Rhizobium hidalgonense TaxID=1538159 RepID=UPI0028718BF9|nr:transcriptional regulator FtrA [Rhizobium hidalgonense]MDR9807059.1 transcriptional regulator FtrA [Rhizobium hidalgonense]